MAQYIIAPATAAIALITIPGIPYLFSLLDPDQRSGASYAGSGRGAKATLSPPVDPSTPWSQGSQRSQIFSLADRNRRARPVKTQVNAGQDRTTRCANTHALRGHVHTRFNIR